MDNTTPTERWTLKELTSRIALALTEADIDQHSGRVRDVPNGRTIRYYTTIGLVDRPLGFRGRAALYGERHLRQVVAIKRLQARGQTLEQVQATLLGLGDAELEAISGIGAAAEAEPVKAETRGDFWDASPAPVVIPATTPRPRPRRKGGARRAQGVALGGGVRLTLGAVRALDDQDIEAIEAAAAPLMALLEARRLLEEEDGGCS